MPRISALLVKVSQILFDQTAVGNLTLILKLSFRNLLTILIHLEVKFVILILCPSEVKLTKTALETGRSFATLFSNMSLRHDLLDAGKLDIIINNSPTK